MSNRYFVFYTEESELEYYMRRLLDMASERRVGILSVQLPLVANLSVLENIILPSGYHYGVTLRAGEQMVVEDLERYNMEHILHNRPSQLSDYQQMVVKFLQIKYLMPIWFAFVNPHRMILSNFQDRFCEFLHCEDLENSLIIEHDNFRYLLRQMEDYREISFDQWQTLDSNTSN